MTETLNRRIRVRRLAAGGLLFLAVLMMLGFLRAGAPLGSPAALLALLVTVGVPAGAGVALLVREGAGARRLAASRERLRAQTLESEVLRLAAARGGRLTALELVSELALPRAEAEELLREIDVRGVAEVQITPSGMLVYDFRAGTEGLGMIEYSRVLTAFALSCLLASGASAQADRRDEVHLRNDCRLAAQVLRTGHPPTKMGWALSFVPECAASGPPVLVERWRAAGAEVSELAPLAASMGSLRDRRLFDAVMLTADDPHAPVVKRVFAVSLLLRWSAPGRILGASQFFSSEALSTDPESLWYPSVTAISHDRQVEGAEPLEEIESAVLSILSRLRRTATDRAIRLISAEAEGILSQVAGAERAN